MKVFLSVVAVVIFSASNMYAWHLEGRIRCDSNGNGIIDTTDVPLPNVVVKLVSTTGGFTGSATTDATGFYIIWLPGVADTYRETLDASTLPSDATFVHPGGGEYVFDVTNTDYYPIRDWLIASALCASGKCWLTGGGVKFDPIIGALTAEKGPSNNLGGNVFPSCSATPGGGGQWNHVAHTLKLHFQGLNISTVACGNVPGIPPGSGSPTTPFNFIEFKGTGSLKGIHGNKVSYGTVYFFARCEDRNEPGSKGANDGALIDRYFLHVFSDLANPVGTTLLLIDQDGNPATVDPVLITGGNLQLHISSCP